MSDMFYANGIDVDSGGYATPPMSVAQLDARLRGLPPSDEAARLRRLLDQVSMGLKAGVDPRRLDQAGWGVIFAAGADPAVEQALGPLIARRAEQAGARFRRYTYTAGDTKRDFLRRHGGGPGAVDPARIPYYLLIVGSPADIPYDFQAQLDAQYAVGRIHFAAPDAYRRYAESVVAAETEMRSQPRRATFFGVSHAQHDTATAQSRSHLIDPLLAALREDPSWQVDPPILDGQATRAALSRCLGGDQTPALLFTASHGLVVPSDNRRNLPPEAYQGALICADWPGPDYPFDQPEYFFAGEDLAPDANLRGLIAFFFACYSAGTPQYDVFGRAERVARGDSPGPQIELAPRPFVADLPQRMLSAPGGGALAVIGHLERSWPTAFVWKAAPDGSMPPQTSAFESVLRQLMDGYPVGHAVDYINQKYTDLAATLKEEFFEPIQYGASYDKSEFVFIWTAANDAQWYAVIGDPAVRLPAAAAGKI